jgi:tetratricopeptide (TPR) repeat protein
MTPPPEADTIRAQLTRILSSPSFQSHPRAGAFLSHVVERVLTGRGSEIKQATIGCDVFGRPASYDPRSDAVVRTVARAVREKLNDYYLTCGANDPVRIEIPKGSYVPRFSWSAIELMASEPEPLPSATRVHRRVLLRRFAVAAACAMAALLVCGMALRRKADLEVGPGSPALYETGRQRLLRGAFVEALPMLERAAAGAPGDARIRAALADDLMNLGYNGRALEEAKKAEAATRRLSGRDALAVEATFRAAAGDRKGTVDALSQLAQLYPESIEYRRRLAQAQIGATQPEDCLRTIKDALILPGAEADSQLATTEAYCRAGTGDYLGALTPARRAIDGARRNRENEIYARARLLEAGLLMSTNQVAQSIASREEAREICTRIGDDSCSIAALRITANLNLFEMRPALALASYRAALPLARKIGSVKETTELLDAEGYALMLTDDFAGANDAFVEAVLTAQRNGVRTFGIRQDMTELALREGQLDRGIMLADETELEARKGSDRVTEAAAQILKARALFLHGDLQGTARLLDGVRHAIEGFHLSADIPREWRIADANLNRALGRLNVAQRDLDAREDLGDTSRDVEYRTAQLQLLLVLGRYNDAVESAREMLGLLEGSGNRSASVLATALLSDAYGFANRLDEARQTALAARSLLSTNTAPISRAAADASVRRWDVPSRTLSRIAWENPALY